MNYSRHSLCVMKINAMPRSSHTKEELSILNFWLNSQYPLIVSRQPEAIHSEQINLALPFYDRKQQKKIRLGFLFDKTAIKLCRNLPRLVELFPKINLDFDIGVYGSHCWEYLTGLSYINKTSDLDLLISHNNESLATLKALYLKLTNEFKKPIDGEIRFSNLGDCAWLELIQEELSPTILIKSYQEVNLVKREHLYAQFPALLF
jgi:phosphoribosyl-dephospho-CoA transferase